MITTYSYNPKNQLSSLITGADSYHYEYDPHGIRTQANINGAVTDYLVDHNQTYAQVLLETTATDQVAYTYGDDLLAMENSAGVHYYHYDGLGSTRQLTDQNETITDSYEYDAYGNLIAQTGTTDNNYLYTGEQYDPNMGFYYLRARYMNPEIGRFTSMDSYAGSAMNPISLNKYTYANANPITYTDPSGYVSLAEFSAASRIRGILNNYTINIGLNFLDPANAEENIRNDLLLGIAAGGGAQAFKLLRLFSSKFRKACNSFTENTLVSTEFGPKDITQINIGDKVWAFNEKDQSITLQEVVHTIEGQELKTTIDITLQSGEVIQATAEHPIYAQSMGLWNWVDAKDITTDMVLIDRHNEPVQIKSVEHNSQKVQVYNLTVANGHTYYITSDEVLVHNTGACIIPKSTRRNHILIGENARGTTGGFHHRPSGEAFGGRKVLERSPVDRNGVYQATVTIKNKDSGQWRVKTPKGQNSMFPDDWSGDKVITEANAAYIQAVRDGFTGGGKWGGRSPSGVWIEGVINEVGEIITAYPKINR